MENIRNFIIKNHNYKTFELMPTNGRKSFYGKAKVIVYPNGAQALISYETIVYPNGAQALISYETFVAFRDVDGKVHRLWDGWSATTGRHIKEFCGMNKAQFTKLDVE